MESRIRHNLMQSARHNGQCIPKLIGDIDEYRVTIFHHEVHKWYVSDKHLPVRKRRTYLSSEWYRVNIENRTTFKTSTFKVRVNHGDYDTALNRAFDMLEDKLDSI